MSVSQIMKFVFPILFIVLAMLSGCEGNSCDDVVCGVNETCAEGRCLCAAGYEGPSCGELAYQKYVGNYFVSENCIEGTPTGFNNAFIQYVGGPVNEIAISNFMNLGGTAFGYIQTDVNSNAGDYFVIDQNINGVQVQAFGYYGVQAGTARITMDVEFTRFNQYYACQLSFF